MHMNRSLSEKYDIANYETPAADRLYHNRSYTKTKRKCCRISRTTNLLRQSCVSQINHTITPAATPTSRKNVLSSMKHVIAKNETCITKRS